MHDLAVALAAAGFGALVGTIVTQLLVGRRERRRDARTELSGELGAIGRKLERIGEDLADVSERVAGCEAVIWAVHGDAIAAAGRPPGPPRRRRPSTRG